MNLRQTETGIYYIHDYYSPKRFPKVTQEQEDLRSLMWVYKDQLHEAALRRFTDELMEALTLISQDIRLSKIGLVAVPPSKTYKKSPIRASIRRIHDWYEEGITLTRFGCDKTIYDYGNLLTRTYDIKTAHREGRTTYEEQKPSIACSRDRLWRYRTAFIILDDVTTKGISMDVCRDILIDNGANEESIYRLAIARNRYRA